jgi:hypothetical protein
VFIFEFIFELVEFIFELFVEFMFVELSVTLLLAGDEVCGVWVVEFILFVLLLCVLSTWANRERHVKVQITDIKSVFIK